MDTIELTARVLLAAVFTVAGLAKLSDRDNVVAASEALGLPQRFSPFAARALPVMELALAVALLVTTTARLALLVAAVLLTIFTAAMLRTLHHGLAVVCRCFGGASDRPIGPSSVLRNVLLLAVAILGLMAANGGAVSLFDWLGGQDAWSLGGAICGLVGATVAGMLVLRWAEHRERRAEAGLVRGAHLPRFSLEDAQGGSVIARELHMSEVTILVFVSDGCGPCRNMKPDLRRWQRTLDHLTLHVLTDGARPASPPMDDGPTLLYDAEGIAQRACRIPATPSALALSADGTVTHGTVSGVQAIEALLRSV